MRPIVRSRERTIGMENRMNPLDRYVVVYLETTGLSPCPGRDDARMTAKIWMAMEGG